MKMKKALALGLAAVMAVSAVGCGSSDSSTTTAESTATTDNTADTTTDTAETTEAADTEEAADTAEATGVPTYAQVNLGEDYTDLTATIKWLHHKTDRAEDGTIDSMIAEFNKVYPNITVETEAITDYAETSLLRLPTGDWGDIMFIPTVDAAELPTYFVPYGTVEEMDQYVNFADNWKNDGNCYGIGYMGNAQGLLYNKAVFEAAGVTTLPTTPDELIAALQAIKDNTDAIPLYTNYAAGWTMGGQWDAYLGAITTGDTTWLIRNSFTQQILSLTTATEQVLTHYTKSYMMQ